MSCQACTRNSSRGGDTSCRSEPEIAEMTRLKFPPLVIHRTFSKPTMINLIMVTGCCEVTNEGPEDGVHCAATADENVIEFHKFELN